MVLDLDNILLGMRWDRIRVSDYAGSSPARGERLSKLLQSMIFGTEFSRFPTLSPTVFHSYSTFCLDQIKSYNLILQAWHSMTLTSSDHPKLGTERVLGTRGLAGKNLLLPSIPTTDGHTVRFRI